MKKAFLIIVLTITFSGFFNIATAQTTIESNSSSSIIQIKSASAIFKNISGAFKNSIEKVTGIKRGEVVAKTKDWFLQRKEAVKIGWQEEKQEFKGGMKEIISDIWNKIKDIILKLFHKRGD